MRSSSLALALASAALALAACSSDATRLLDGATPDVVAAPDDVPAPDVPAPDVPVVDVPVVDVAADVPAPDDVPLGATVTAAGVRFRVWAPGATAATVRGDFAERAMTRGADGVWEALAPDARAGQRYRYVFRRGEASYTRVDPRARELRDGESVVTGPDAYPWRATTFRAPSLREAVLYELHVGSFDVPAGAANGTFESVTRRLDALVDLGVNVLALMPVNDFGSGTRWGYGPRHYHAPNAAYGPSDALRRLVDEAHARGVAVLHDVVYNHYTGGRDAPLHCFDGDCADGGAGVYFFRDPAYRSTPWGPRPDFASPPVRDYLLDGIGVWVHGFRIDGFRWDSLSNVRAVDGMGTVPGGRELVLRANALTRAARPDALLVAEDLKGYEAITRPAAAGGFGFDTQWDGFVYVAQEQLAPGDDDARSMAAVRNMVTGGYNGDGFQRIVGTENHDTVGNGGVRFPERVDRADPASWTARKRSMLAAAMAFTVPGVPMLFMGQEHLERGTFAPTPAPLDWARAEGHRLVRQYYRALARMRRNLDGVTAGLAGAGVQVIHQHDANKVIAWRRWSRSGDDVVVIANLRNRRYARYSVGLPAGGAWRVRLDSDDPRWSTDFRGPAQSEVTAEARPYDNQPFTGTVALGPWSVVVLSR